MDDPNTRPAVQLVLGHVQVLERRAGRTASRLSVGVPHSVDLKAAQSSLCEAICSTREPAPIIEVRHIAGRTTQLLTVDFDLVEVSE
ncbi:MAG: hypothetical protein AB8H79_10195 [Myxococcota bacterium]